MVADDTSRSRGLFKITDPDDPEVWRVTNRLSIRKLAGTGRGPGSRLIGAATILLALLGAGLFFVSFRGQFVYLFRPGTRTRPRRSRRRCSTPA